MSDATVLRESTNDGYYMVLPSMGKGEVEAIDMQRAGFSAKEKATIIQIGSEYGIVSKSERLTGVLAVPADSRKAVALKNPAQFALAYFATLLGNIKRAYAVAVVLSVGAKTMLLQYIGGIDGGKQFYAAPMAGLSLGNFAAGESVVVNLLQLTKPTVCGWWSTIEYFDQLILGEVTDLLIMLKDKTGAQIIESSPSEVWVEYGHYDLEGEITGIPGAFLPFYHRKAFNTEDRDGLCAYDSFNPMPFLPNKFRITYQYDGEWLTKTFDADGFVTSYAGGLELHDDYGTAFEEDGSLTLIPSPYNATFESTDFVGYKDLMLFVKPGPYLLQIYSDGSVGRVGGLGMPGTIQISSDGSWSLTGSDLYPDATYGGSISAAGKLRKEKPRYDLLGSLSQFKSSCVGSVTTSWEIGDGARAFNTIDLNSNAELVLTHSLEAKPYTPSVTTPPPWADDDLPTSIIITGAGTGSANGEYTLVDGMFMNESADHFVVYDGSWFIAFFDGGDIGWLYSNSLGSGAELPKTGWQVVDGAAPAPTVAY